MVGSVTVVLKPGRWHGGTSTGPANGHAGPNGGWACSYVKGAGGGVSPPVGTAAGPFRAPDATDIESGSLVGS